MLVRVRSRCHGCEVERSESTETRSPDEVCRGWRMANDSTRSSAMSDVCEHSSDWLFTKVIPTGYLQSDPHWLFAK